MENMFGIQKAAWFIGRIMIQQENIQTDGLSTRV